MAGRTLLPGQAPKVYSVPRVPRVSLSPTSPAREASAQLFEEVSSVVMEKRLQILRMSLRRSISTGLQAASREKGSRAPPGLMG